MTSTTTSTTTGTTTGSASSPAPTTNIRPSELRQLLLEDPLTRILDVRTGGEFESVHIPGSFNVPLDLLSEHVTDVAHLDHPVVLVCQSGSRATTAQSKLNEAGKRNLRVLEGGIGAWQTTGGDIATGEQTWSLERQVRLTAGTIVLTASLVGIKFVPARAIAGAVGFGLAFSALTDTCAMGNVLAKLPHNRGPKCDLDAVIAALGAEQTAGNGA